MQLQELIDSGIYDTRDDFTVVIQPFLRDSVLPYTEDGQVDATYFAPDCFHFSDIGHAMGAINLWNNMVSWMNINQQRRANITVSETCLWGGRLSYVVVEGCPIAIELIMNFYRISNHDSP